MGALLACCATHRTEGGGSPLPDTHSHKWAAPLAGVKELSRGVQGEVDQRGDGADESDCPARLRSAPRSWQHHGNRWPAGGGSREWGSDVEEPCQVWECGQASESNDSWEPQWKGSEGVLLVLESESVSGIGTAGHEGTLAPSPTGLAPCASSLGSCGQQTLAGSVL